MKTGQKWDIYFQRDTKSQIWWQRTIISDSWLTKMRGSQVQVLPNLQNEFRANSGNLARPYLKMKRKEGLGMPLVEESPTPGTLAGWNRRAVESMPAWALSITKTKPSFLLKIYITNQRKHQLAFIILLLLLIISITFYLFIRLQW